MDMDNIGAEVSAEIRRAIVAKLEELKAYVDDELPEYIMVMIANKKSVDQMAGDLSLFLNDHAQPFAEWLQGVLDKLKSVTAAAKTKNPKKKKIKGAKEDGGKKSKVKKKGDKKAKKKDAPCPGGKEKGTPEKVKPKKRKREHSGMENSDKDEPQNKRRARRSRSASPKPRSRERRTSRTPDRHREDSYKSPQRKRPRAGDFYEERHRRRDQRSPRRSMSPKHSHRRDHQRSASPAPKAGKGSGDRGRNVGAVISKEQYDPEQMLKKSIVASKVSATPRQSKSQKGANGSVVVKASKEADQSVQQKRDQDRNRGSDLDEVHRKRRQLTKLQQRGELDDQKLKNINNRSDREDGRSGGRRNRQRSGNAGDGAADGRRNDDQRQNGKNGREVVEKSKKKESEERKVIKVVEEAEKKEKTGKTLPDLRERLLARRKEREQQKEKTAEKDEDELSKMRQQALESMNRRRGLHHDHGRCGSVGGDLDRIRTKEAQIEELKKVINEIKGGAGDSDDDSSSDESSSSDSSSSDSSQDDDSDEGITKIIHSAGKLKNAKGPEFFVTLNGIGNANSYFDKIKDSSEPTVGGLKLKKNRETSKTVYVKTGKPAPSKVTPVKDSPPKKCPEKSSDSTKSPVSTLEARREKLMTDKPKAMVAPIQNRSPTHQQSKPQRKRVEAPKHDPAPSKKSYFPSSMPLPSRDKTYSPEIEPTCKYWPNCERGSSCKYYHPSGNRSSVSSSGGGWKRVCFIV